jgi:hypothetical protein
MCFDPGKVDCCHSQLVVTIRENLHVVGARAKRCQQGLDPLVGVVVDRSHKSDIALAQVSANGAPGHHLKVLLPIWIAVPDIATVQSHRGHVQHVFGSADF